MKEKIKEIGEEIVEWCFILIPFIIPILILGLLIVFGSFVFNIATLK